MVRLFLCLKFTQHFGNPRHGHGSTHEPVPRNMVRLNMDVTKGFQLADGLWTELENSLPPVIARIDVPKFFSGLISHGWMANRDCAGTGPRSFKLGKKVAYTRGDFITWLRSMNGGE